MDTYLFTAATVIYVLSFLLHSISASFNRTGFYKPARMSAYFAAIIASAGLLLRWESAGHPPLSNMYESLVTFSTILAWISLFFTREFPLPLAEGGSAIICVLMLGISSLFPSEVKPLVPALQSYWLHLHVSLSFIGEACFALAFVLSYLFCLRRFLEGRSFESAEQPKVATADNPEKFICATVITIIPLSLLGVMTYIAWRYLQVPETVTRAKTILAWIIGPLVLVLILLVTTFYLFRGAVGRVAQNWLPPTAILDELTHRSISLGYPIFSIGALVFGMIWANKAWGRYWGWDPKETWALITFLTYSLYLHVRLTRGWSGTWLALLSITGFLLTVFTLFGVNLLLSGLHSYVF